MNRLIGRGALRGIVGILFKALLYRYIGVWAYLFGWTTRDVFIIPALAAKLGGMLPSSGSAGGYSA